MSPGSSCWCPLVWTFFGGVAVLSDSSSFSEDDPDEVVDEILEEVIGGSESKLGLALPTPELVSDSSLFSEDDPDEVVDEILEEVIGGSESKSGLALPLPFGGSCFLGSSLDVSGFPGCFW